MFFIFYMMEIFFFLGMKDSIVDLIYKGIELEDFVVFNLLIEDIVIVCL